jgi:hypothetical protein
MAYQAGTTVTIVTSATFSASDVGKIIVWSDGTESIITAYLTTSTCTVNRSETKGGAGSELAIAWDYAARSFNDIYADDDLRNARAGWLLKHRFFSELPNSDLGLMVPGFLACTKKGCSQETIGSHNPFVQYYSCDDGIRAISSTTDAILLYHTNSRTKVFSSIYENISDQSANGIGEAIFQLTQGMTINDGVGILTDASLQKTLDGLDIFLSQDKRLFTWDGNVLKQLFANQIQRKLDKLQGVGASHYDKWEGYMFFGTENAAFV